MLLRAVLAATLILLTSAAPAQAAPRVATTSEGVTLTLDEQTLTMRVPATVRAGSELQLRCGHGWTFAEGKRAAVRPGEDVIVRLTRALPAAEWCAFETEHDGDDRPQPYGAGTLEPRLVPAPPPVQPGPGVRTGAAELANDDALSGSGSTPPRFLLAGRTLTVHLPAPFRSSTLVSLACMPFGLEDLDFIPRATVAVDRGQRTVTAELVEGDLSSLTGCLIEDDLGGGDIAGTDLGPPPGPLQTLRLFEPDMLPRLQPRATMVFDLTAYRNRAPAVGDIVLARLWSSRLIDGEIHCGTPRRLPEDELCVRPRGGPASEPLRFATRVVATAGDRVAFRRGRVIRNGRLERRKGLRTCRGFGCDYPRAITVPAGHVYVAGDNRGRSFDSRFFGAVPVDWVVGRYVRTLPRKR